MLAYCKEIRKLVPENEVSRIAQHLRNKLVLLPIPSKLSGQGMHNLLTERFPWADYVFLSEDYIVFLTEYTKVHIMEYGSFDDRMELPIEGQFTEQGLKEYKREYDRLPQEETKADPPIQEAKQADQASYETKQPVQEYTDEELVKFVNVAYNEGTARAADKFSTERVDASAKGRNINRIIIAHIPDISYEKNQKLSEECYTACLRELGIEREVQPENGETGSADLLDDLKKFLDVASSKSIQQAMNEYPSDNFFNLPEGEKVRDIIQPDIDKAHKSSKPVKLHHARYNKCMRLLVD